MPVAIRPVAAVKPAPAKAAPAKLAAKVASVAAAAAISFTLATGAATAVDEAALKKIVCARTPTAKICLRNSANE